MSSYLLDTHALLWWHENDEQMPDNIKRIIEDLSNNVAVSIASFWEIVIKLKTGKLELEYSIDGLINACMTNKIEIIPIKFNHLNTLLHLPLIHRDPFDRMIVAAAYSDGTTLISKDEQLSDYNIHVIW